MSIAQTPDRARDRHFEGKSAFVTGAGNGIGRAIAIALGQAGAKVILFDRALEGMEETARQMSQYDAEAVIKVGDVTDRDSVFSAVAQSAEQLGSLDYAVNNAGILGGFADTDAYPIDEYRKVMDVNLFGVVHSLQAELEIMRRQGSGSIVNIASAAGIVGWVGRSPYVTSKHAVIGLTKTAALEFAARNIRVNAVCPAFVYSELTSDLLGTNESHAAAVGHHPVGRIGQPHEIADATLWLLSPRSGFAIGSSVVLDGGYTIQ